MGRTQNFEHFYKSMTSVFFLNIKKEKIIQYKNIGDNDAPCLTLPCPKKSKLQEM